NYHEISPALSILNLVKFSKQAFFNGHEKYYNLPSNREINFIMPYVHSDNSDASLLYSFIDSTQQLTRMSFRLKDIGTDRMEELSRALYAEVDTVFSSGQE